MGSDDSSISSMTAMFESEFTKLKLQLDAILTDTSKSTIPQIISIYHQVLNVTSLIHVFKQSAPQDECKNLINYAETLISTKFNSVLHPKFLEQLSALIDSSVNALQTQTNLQKSTTEIKNDAASYDKLRELMSTREFVKQYDQGLTND